MIGKYEVSGVFFWPFCFNDSDILLARKMSCKTCAITKMGNLPLPIRVFLASKKSKSLKGLGKRQIFRTSLKLVIHVVPFFEGAKFLPPLTLYN